MAADAGMVVKAVVVADTGVAADEDKGGGAEWEWGVGDC